MLKYKAVRDKIPLETNELVRFPNELYLHLMREKLDEEVKEYKEKFEIEELVDIMEVCYKIAELQGSAGTTLYTSLLTKRMEKGAFNQNKVWIRKEDNKVFYE